MTWREIDIPLAPGADPDPSNPSYPGHSVECVSSTWCIAVGSYIRRDRQTTVAISVFNGQRWRSRMAATQSRRSIDGQEVSCWAVGECWITAFASAPNSSLVQAHALRWTHGAVRDERPFGGPRVFTDFPDISCPATDYCMVLGGFSSHGITHQHQEIATWNGTTWQHHRARYAPTHTGPFAPLAVTCFADRTCVTAGDTTGRNGDAAVQIHRDGQWTSRTVETIPNHGAGLLQDITCPTRERCITTGDYFQRNRQVSYVLAGSVTG